MRRAPIATLIFFGAVALFWAAVATVFASSAIGGGFPLTALFTTIVLASVAASGIVAGDEQPLRARFFAAIASLGLAPILTCAAMIALDAEIDREAHAKCGLASIGLLFLAIVGGCAGLLLSTTTAAIAARRPFAHEEWLVRLLATAAAGAVIVAASLATERALQGDVSAPLGWIVEAWMGGAIAFACLALGWRVRRRAAPRLSWREAEHASNGWIHMHDGTAPRHVPAAMRLRTGPVLVHVGEHWPSPYRDDGRSHTPEIYPASLDELRTTTRERSLALSSFALAAAVLACAPLLAAAFFGIAF